MTLREQLQAKLDDLDAQLKAINQQSVLIREHLAQGGSELDHEENALIDWAESVIMKVKALL